MREAVGKRGVSVVVIPGDVALQPAPVRRRRSRAACCRRARRAPAGADLDRLAAMLNGDAQRHDPVRFGLRGRARGAAGARRTSQGADGARVARQGACRVGESLRRRHDRTDWLFVRLLCHARLRRSADARHRLSLSAVLSARAGVTHRPGRYPAGEYRTPHARSISASWATSGDAQGAAAAAQKKTTKRISNRRSGITPNHAQELDDLAAGKPGSGLIHPQQIAKAVSDHAAEDAIFTCDVGLPTVWAARYLAMNGKRRLLGSSGTDRWPMPWRRRSAPRRPFPGARSFRSPATAASPC